ncbi:adenosylcobinamide-GDP ribazoletransferase, partial [Bradyrhizobium sp. Arg68]|uniref:adenosylcobinamide-GDP ribazoletransferase n=1 Tax=Bradyrhizobium ivorense TaxID=2511166 RepID=UPI001E4B188D
MNQWLDDLRTTIAFLTRLPMPHPDGARPENFARAQRLFPVVGALIGAAIGLFCLLLRTAGVPD